MTFDSMASPSSSLLPMDEWDFEPGPVAPWPPPLPPRPRYISPYRSFKPKTPMVRNYLPKTTLKKARLALELGIYLQGYTTLNIAQIAKVIDTVFSLLDWEQLAIFDEEERSDRVRNIYSTDDNEEEEDLWAKVLGKTTAGMTTGFVHLIKRLKRYGGHIRGVLEVQLLEEERDGMEIGCFVMIEAEGFMERLRSKPVKFYASPPSYDLPDTMLASQELRRHSRAHLLEVDLKNICLEATPNKWPGTAVQSWLAMGPRPWDSMVKDEEFLRSVRARL